MDESANILRNNSSEFDRTRLIVEKSPTKRRSTGTSGGSSLRPAKSRFMYDDENETSVVNNSSSKLENMILTNNGGGNGDEDHKERISRLIMQSIERSQKRQSERIAAASIPTAAINDTTAAPLDVTSDFSTGGLMNRSKQLNNSEKVN